MYNTVRKGNNYGCVQPPFGPCWRDTSPHKGCSSSARSRRHLLQQRFLWRRSADAVFTAGGSCSIWKRPQRPWSTWARRHVRGRRRSRERSAQTKQQTQKTCSALYVVWFPNQGGVWRWRTWAFEARTNVSGLSKGNRYVCREHIWRGEISNQREVMYTYAN